MASVNNIDSSEGFNVYGLFSAFITFFNTLCILADYFELRFDMHVLAFSDIAVNSAIFSSKAAILLSSSYIVSILLFTY